MKPAIMGKGASLWTIYKATERKRRGTFLKGKREKQEQKEGCRFFLEENSAVSSKRREGADLGGEEIRETKEGGERSFKIGRAHV